MFVKCKFNESILFLELPAELAEPPLEIGSQVEVHTLTIIFENEF
jgi:hypothetical protein